MPYHPAAPCLIWCYLSGPVFPLWLVPLHLTNMPICSLTYSDHTLLLKGWYSVPNPYLLLTFLLEVSFLQFRAYFFLIFCCSCFIAFVEGMKKLIFYVISALNFWTKLYFRISFRRDNIYYFLFIFLSLIWNIIRPRYIRLFTSNITLSSMIAFLTDALPLKLSLKSQITCHPWRLVSVQIA